MSEDRLLFDMALAERGYGSVGDGSLAGESRHSFIDNADAARGWGSSGTLDTEVVERDGRGREPFGLEGRLERRSFK